MQAVFHDFSTIPIFKEKVYSSASEVDISGTDHLHHTQAVVLALVMPGCQQLEVVLLVHLTRRKNTIFHLISPSKSFHSCTDTSADVGLKHADKKSLTTSKGKMISLSSVSHAGRVQWRVRNDSGIHFCFSRRTLRPLNNMRRNFRKCNYESPC